MGTAGATGPTGMDGMDGMCTPDVCRPETCEEFFWYVCKRNTDPHPEATGTRDGKPKKKAFLCNESLFTNERMRIKGVKGKVADIEPIARIYNRAEQVCP